MILPRRVLYYGRDEALPEQVELRAGPLSLVYEDGDVRYIRLGQQEILRRIYVAIRDRNWGTVEPAISGLQMETSDNSFDLSYVVENIEDDIDFVWKGRITGDPDGTVRFTMDGVARSTFLRNRIGFCVLHPMKECAGEPCVVEKVDGTVKHGEFPQYISPHQPFLDMRAISHEVVPGVWAEVRFEGDVFEMEDQRNWTDASYKTYCTPLSLPFPVEVKRGTRISQSVTLTLRGEVPEVSVESDDAGLAFSVGEVPAGSLPRIGLEVPQDGEPLTTTELDRLERLNLSHLRVELPLHEGGYGKTLRKSAAEARELGVPLEVAIVLSDNAADELERFVQVLHREKPVVDTWLVFHVGEKSTTAKWIRLARDFLEGYNPDAKIGSGTNAFFTELNRERPPIEDLDLVTYSVNPQVHAFDNLSLVETLEAQAATVRSARQFSGDLPLSISPVTLKMRFNPNATGPEPDPAPGELPPQVDERQMSLFGAGWSLGSLKYISESDVYSVTYYETRGWLGVMEKEDGWPVPDKFRSLPGAVFPMYHVFADIGEFAGGEVLPCVSSRTLLIDGLAVRKDGKTRVLLANLSPDVQHVVVSNLSKDVRLRHLDETNVGEAMVSPERFRTRDGTFKHTSGKKLTVELLPYGIVRIDSVTGGDVCEEEESEET